MAKQIILFNLFSLLSRNFRTIPINKKKFDSLMFIANDIIFKIKRLLCT